MTACSGVHNLTGSEDADISSRLSGRKKSLSFTSRFKASLKQLLKSSFKRDVCTARHRSYGPGEIQHMADTAELQRFPSSATSFTLSARYASGSDLRRVGVDDVHNLPESARSSSACASVFSTRLSAAADSDAPARSGSSFLGAFSTAERAAAAALESEAPQSAPGRLSRPPEVTQPQPSSSQHRAHSSAHRPRRPVQVVVVLEEDEEDEEHNGTGGRQSPHRALTMPSLSAPACSPLSRATSSSTLAWAEADGAASRSPRPTYSPAGGPRGGATSCSSATASRRGSSGAVTTGGAAASAGGVTAAAYVAAMRLRGTTGGMVGGGGGGGGLSRSPSATGERRRPSLSRFGVSETAAGRSMSMTLTRPASVGGPAGLSITVCSPSSPSAGVFGGSLGGRCGGAAAASAEGLAAGGGHNRAVSLPAVSSFSSLRAALLSGGTGLAPAVPAPAAASTATLENHGAESGAASVGGPVGTLPRADTGHNEDAAPALVSNCSHELATSRAGLMSVSSGEREA